MCVRSAEVVAMSCGIDYRHCPLKKRPVYIGYDSVEEPDATGVCDLMEPENLSMKPEDLRSTCKILGHTRVVDSTFSCPKVSDESQSCLILASADLSRNYQFRIEPSPEQFDGFFHVSEDYSRNLGTKCSIEYYPSASRFPTSYIGRRHLQRQHRTTSDNQGDNYYHPNLSTEHLLSFRHLKFYKSYLSPLKKIHPYQRARSCELTTTSQTSSHFPGSYEADSFQSKTHEDLLSPVSVTSSEGSSISSSGYDNGPKCERRSSRYQCSFCLKTYSTHSGLLKHKDFHCAAKKESTAKKAFICKYCQKVYLSLGALKMHIRTHTLPCKCVICGKAFSRPWLLQGHIRTHTGEKPFSCPLCERAFADRSNLRAHLQTHSEVKKYSCASCGKTFSRMSLLTKHQESGCSTL